LIYITTDDLNPKFLDYWTTTFDVLKEEFPQLEVTAFTVPVWENNSKYKLNDSRAWNDWYEAHKDWVHIAMHGYHHLRCTTKTKFEGYQSYEEQLELYGKSLDILKPYMPKYWGFKPPFYKWNSATLDALAKLNCTWAHLEAKIHWFKKDAIDWYGTILESHINPECKMPDRVHKIMKYLRWILSNQVGNLNDLALGKYGNILKLNQVSRHVSDKAWLNPSYYIEDEMRWFNERVKLTPPGDLH